MGSLMAGWDSPVLGDGTKARVTRNRSLTKEEVEAFWRQRGKPAPEDGGDVTSPLGSPGRPMEKSPLGSSQRSRSPASSPVSGVHEETIGAADAGKSRDWWTRSNWAFLNEPPQEERPGTAHTYTPQFHVAAGNA
ncbi:hypothetical protein CFC21_054463 [Triticum aestivum]|uniref:Uncharacterized protein n=2 Tax=Triticum aestivum TaxID=4565 RepID=A0A3B6I038_WHEAT|nr:uncharacterized protein LOC119287618 [Triticum dicoccoides]XP_044361012.1 uncharacterized protein LOC123082842 [Triticum aestivum]KAF7045351.1 hypothetical protein CFC21_054463 [Triticum aestivum]